MSRPRPVRRLPGWVRINGRTRTISGLVAPAPLARSGDGIANRNRQIFPNFCRDVFADLGSSGKRSARGRLPEAPLKARQCGRPSRPGSSATDSIDATGGGSTRRMGWHALDRREAIEPRRVAQVNVSYSDQIVPSSARRRRGFTLIELLVVIAIISLLMALGAAGPRRGPVDGPTVAVSEQSATGGARPDRVPQPAQRLPEGRHFRRDPRRGRVGVDRQVDHQQCLRQQRVGLRDVHSGHRVVERRRAAL